jgi:hypothetical protein
MAGASTLSRHVLLGGVDELRPVARPSIGRWAGLALAITAIVLATGAAGVHLYVTAPVTTPLVTAPSLLRALSDRRLVTLSTTTPTWTKRQEVVTVDRLRTDHRLWRRMHFRDWDAVPAAFRQPALMAMMRSHGDVMRGPRVWQTMTAEDWDVVPQPIRAMLYLRMIWYWTLAEDVGADFGLDPLRLAPTVGAIVMAESWFEHRAFNENPFGNRDLGLAQCSDSCRRTIGEMVLAGEIQFAPTEADYFNPWIGTRVATVWFKRELGRASGDVELAIRAYHRGIDNALDEKGDIYLRSVLEKRERYVLDSGRSASWRFLAREMSPL